MCYSSDSRHRDQNKYASVLEGTKGEIEREPGKPRVIMLTLYERERSLGGSGLDSPRNVQQGLGSSHRVSCVTEMGLLEYTCCVLPRRSPPKM